MEQQRSLSHKASTLTTTKRGRKKDHIEQFISSPQMLLKSSLSQLRYMILVDGLSEFAEPSSSTHPYRIYVWSILLRAPPMETDQYLKLIQMGRSKLYDKIINDTFRTLTTDKEFQAKISEDSLIRVLSAYSWCVKEPLSPYVQGMNVLLSPILYSSKSEPELFKIFHRLLTSCIPTYVTPMLKGVHTGLILLDLCLEIIDYKLFKFLNSKYLKSEIYAFASVLTLSSCTPPLKEVLKLWDFLFSYGCHMNILFVIAQLILIRTPLMESSKPMSLLRSFPLLNAKEIIKLSVSFLTKLPEELYDLLVRHTYEDITYDLEQYSKKNT